MMCGEQKQKQQKNNKTKLGPLLKSPIFFIQKAAAPNNGVAYRQKCN